MRRFRAVIPRGLAAGIGARRAELLYLPGALVLALVHAAAKHLGAFESRPLVGAWLVAAAIFLLLWPLPWLRMGAAASRAASLSTTDLVSRLRAFALLFYILAAVSTISLAMVVGLLVLASLPRLPT
ncbi:hypothetical protein AGMMS50256_24280 [Betaproteobacteria bacterium]|nr:hypothetical protein AGMMS50256_24280 [Betaproteobacteria bacterium]